jgi:hypothetical protein
MLSTKATADQPTRSKAVTRRHPGPKSKPAPNKSARATIYQLKITLNDIRPPIWRRVQTRDCTLGRLHDLIQMVMPWDDFHLHEFEIGAQRFGALEQWQDNFWGEDPEVGNERKVKLSQLVGQGVKKFHYQYDMGDSWAHTITIEKTLPAEPGVKYPRCIAGERAGPPEDSGGPWGYGDFVEAVQNPRHDRHDELLEWVGGEFDPETFDLEAVNEALQEMG